MQINNWTYYNHAAVPCCAPHEDADLKPIIDGTIWSLKSKSGSAPLMAVYHTDFDMEAETSYWFIIKDEVLSLDEFSKKRQKFIRKSLERCEVKMINPAEYADDMYDVYQAAFKCYKNADNEADEKSFKENVKSDGLEYWGAFSTETGQMAGWMSCHNHGDWTETISAKYHPDMQTAVRPSESIHYYVLQHYLNELGQKYVCSGARNLNHKTTVQDYKIRNWHFRRAYCRLHIVYNPKIKWIVMCLYPLRMIFRQFDFITRIHQFNSLLRMEEIARRDSKITPPHYEIEIIDNQGALCLFVGVRFLETNGSENISKTINFAA